MSLETLEKCPVCDKSSFNNYLNVEDHTVSHKEFTIQQCNSCYFLFTNPRPSEDNIGPYYESQNYISHHDESSDLISKAYNFVRNYTIGQKVDLINKLANKKGSLLDIGCGTGNFVNAAKENGWQVSATEPDSEARKIASKKLGLNIEDSINVDALTEKNFDVITLWHVLEHVHRLNETIGWLVNHMNEEGTLIVAVPNPESFDALKYERFWAAYDVPRHLYHFTKATMKQLLHKHNLVIDEVLPMWFDSFYVGMLSTKYKQKKLDMIDSVRTGLQSNWKGKSSKHTEINTSSLIYVIRKR
ncbi:class I SAM-dependent methyltransferase [Dyadobacter arcticus]|uniref:2-polyprenyl-3-methyl-5-hydroxy-6-metoxy-1, 4-benzoquinol methylase n=1 Tax=Dyadobacter arcticus TaxID=1078754 RepID=A0ABX0UWG5_9BACT|nr:class I SAM-dependent methyltransferase [Dyadobacter arcticus]NIJ56165.1 2-polyprenyl-3-methyl-5-hydroxy-6-metoxy-1,4-benzoquinol methylase [Dyadobacter arcticus]